MTDAVVGLAQVFTAEEQGERAAELMAFAVTCPATQHSTREQAKKLLDDLETRLPSEIFAAATARGRARQIEDVVAELMAG